MSVVTTNSNVESAIALAKKATTTYLALGKKTAWANDEVPPTPSADATKLEEVIGYKKVSKVSLCRPKKQNETPTYPTVEYNNMTWVLIPENKAYEEKATFVYYEAEVLGTELPLGAYRQVGIHTGVTPNSEVSKTALLPTEISNTGILQFLDNRKPYTRTSEVTIRERFIVSTSGRKV